MKKNNSISIVTAYFDIGRGEWGKNQPENSLKRTNDDYFNYFSHLARLENDMVIFTTEDFEDRICKLRGNRPTKIVTLDLQKDFQPWIDKIANIQASETFRNKVNSSQIQSPEYWSAPYVLINNLKPYFVLKAIKEKLVSHKQVAWFDFGYIRNEDTLAGVKEWKYSFHKHKMNFFTIKTHKYLKLIKNPKYPKNDKQVHDIMFNNKILIIGSVYVGTHKTWQKFYDLIRNCQDELLSNNIIDDDQGVYVMCHYKKPKLFKLHYLARHSLKKSNWFSLFKLYNNN